VEVEKNREYINQIIVIRWSNSFWLFLSRRDQYICKFVDVGDIHRYYYKNLIRSVVRFISDLDYSECALFNIFDHPLNEVVSGKSVEEEILALSLDQSIK